MANTPRTILLVDDNETNRYTLSRHLVRNGYHVVEAGTAEEGLSKLKTGADLLILDVHLPDMSGYDVSRMLRGNPATRLMPILQISATFTMSSDKVKGLDAGADGYLATPVEPDELLAHVRTLLRLKDAQDALAKSNDRLKSVLSHIVDVFFSLDFDHRFLELNPAAEKLLGRPADSLAGKKLEHEFPQAGPEFAKRCEEAVRQRHSIHFEGSAAINQHFWYEAHIYPREDRLDIYLRDISERKLNERRINDAAEQLRRHVQELQSAQSELAKARDQLSLQNELLEARVRERTARLEETINDLETFSYSITHDMRAPLRAMQGFSRLLLEAHGEVLDAEGIDYLNRIANSANRLDMLIRDVLSYSNIVRTPLKLVRVDTDKLLRDILREYPGFQPPQAKIEIQGSLPPVLGNEAFLTQCFSNLLSNAVKFVRPDLQPEVRVSSTVNDGFVRLNFTDNGIGIPEDHQRRLFTLFHRAQSTYPGTGIGLAVIRKAVERMGGRVGLESTAGRGSTFWLELRKAQD